MGFLDATGITRLVTDLKNKFASKTNFEQLQADATEIARQVETKQDKLVSGTNIKTVDGKTLLGNGNIAFPSINYEELHLKSGATIATALEGSGSDRIWFTSADGTKLVPINTSTSGWSGTKTLNTTPINPFMQIYHYQTSVSDGGYIYGQNLYIKCKVAIPYSYVKTLTGTLPCICKVCAENRWKRSIKRYCASVAYYGRRVRIYFLGMAHSSYYFELSIAHPVFWHDGTSIRLWDGKVHTHADSLLVTITRSSGRAGAMDKTWGEIKAVLDAGISPVICDDSAYTTTIYVSVSTKSIIINNAQSEPFTWTTDDSYPTYSGSGGGGSND